MVERRAVQKFMEEEDVKEAAIFLGFSQRTVEDPPPVHQDEARQCGSNSTLLWIVLSSLMILPSGEAFDKALTLPGGAR